MKNSIIIISALSLIGTIWRIWWLLNERLLGIEMNVEDFGRWVHDDLNEIHAHLDECNLANVTITNRDKGGFHAA